jgi:hypothetical protein
MGIGWRSVFWRKVELLDSHSKLVAAGVSSSEEPVVMLKVSVGSYSLKLSHPEMNTVTRAVQLLGRNIGSQRVF